MHREFIPGILKSRAREADRMEFRVPNSATSRSDNSAASISWSINRRTWERTVGASFREQGVTVADDDSIENGKSRNSDAPSSVEHPWEKNRLRSFSQRAEPARTTRGLREATNSGTVYPALAGNRSSRTDSKIATSFTRAISGHRRYRRRSPGENEEIAVPSSSDRTLLEAQGEPEPEKAQGREHGSMPGVDRIPNEPLMAWFPVFGMGYS